jgi:hypothetical protein
VQHFNNLIIHVLSLLLPAKQALFVFVGLHCTPKKACFVPLRRIALSRWLALPYQTGPALPYQTGYAGQSNPAWGGIGYLAVSSCEASPDALRETALLAAALPDALREAALLAAALPDALREAALRAAALLAAALTEDAILHMALVRVF